MVDFEVTRDLPPPIGQLNDEERQFILEALPALAAGDERPLLLALKDLLESRVSEQEYEEYQELFESDQRAILQRVAEQIPDLTGVRLAPHPDRQE